MEQHGQPIPPQARYRDEPDWPSLLSRVLDDFSRVIQMEARLFEANLSQVLTSLLERTLAQLLLLSTVLAGGWCLLGALIIGLHTLIPWWAAFAVAGGILIGVGIAGYLTIESAARRTGSQSPVAT